MGCARFYFRFKVRVWGKGMQTRNKRKQKQESHVFIARRIFFFKRFPDVKPEARTKTKKKKTRLA